MDRNIIWKLVLVGLIVVVATIELYPPSEKLKGGIDLVGGTSLLYGIDDSNMPSDQTHDLAEKVIQVIRRRVDPDGVRNLIFRAEGRNRIEIQMPQASAATINARNRYEEALAKVEALNIDMGKVRHVLEFSPQQKDAQLADAIAAMPARKEMIEQLSAARDKLREALASKNDDRIAAAEADYEQKRSQLVATNVDITRLVSTLEMEVENRDRASRLNEIKAQHPHAASLIDQLDAAYRDYAKLRGRLDDPADLQRLLRGAGVLEFRILAEPDPANPGKYDEQRKRLRERGPDRPGRVFGWFEIEDPKDFKLHNNENAIIEEYGGKQYVLAYVTSDKSMTQSGDRKWRLEGARPDRDSRGMPCVDFTFDELGARRFEPLTRNNLHKPLCILLDGKAISAPIIQAAIRRQGTITGEFSMRQVTDLVDKLNAGSLPARIGDEPLSVRTIGPSIGRENREEGFRAGVIGFATVVAFILVYYLVAGAVANVALALNVLLILSGMVVLGATFTLPGIAGVILTIGMAVDANVLIFERIREESARGASLRMAIKNGYERALSTIVDANVTTFITALILWLVASEEVKGFAITLMLGIVMSLFTALFVTRAIFDFLIARGWLKKLTMLQIVRHAQVTWYQKRRLFYALSAILVVAGAIEFFSQGDEKYDIEFVSGTAIQIDFKPGQEMPASEVRKIFAQAARQTNSTRLQTAQIQEIGEPGANQRFEIITAETNRELVEDTVRKAFAGHLNVQEKINFQLVKDPNTCPEGFRPITRQLAEADDRLFDFRGGVMITVDKLDPPQSIAQLKERITAMHFQPDFESLPWRDFDVIGLQPAPGSLDHFVKVAYVTVENDIRADDEHASEAWVNQVARPELKRLIAALTRTTAFSKVTRYDPQVASQALQQAIVAIILAVVAIVLYVWVRFGTARYGIAAIVAVVHDVIITLGLCVIMGFQINLALVAALLTIIGYSLNDTIVVFDRIRENRGKLALNSDIINASINQTLSRTLLTSFTTFIVVTIMFAFGGPGIHGFSFAMMVGIFVGTYSSIAIASPALLFRTGARERRPAPAPAARPQRA